MQKPTLTTLARDGKRLGAELALGVGIIVDVTVGLGDIGCRVGPRPLAALFGGCEHP